MIRNPISAHWLVFVYKTAACYEGNFFPIILLDADEALVLGTVFAWLHGTTVCHVVLRVAYLS